MYFIAPEQENLTNFYSQISKIRSNFAPQEISPKQYLPYLQNYNVLSKLFDRNVNLSIEVQNIKTSQTDILVKKGYIILDYTVINQISDITLTIDKQYLVDNNYYAIVFATYEYPLNSSTQVPNNYSLGIVLFDPSTNSLVPTTTYSEQAYDLFVNSNNKLLLKIFQFTYDSAENQWLETKVESITIDDESFSTIPDLNNTSNQLIKDAFNFGTY